MSHQPGFFSNLPTVQNSTSAPWPVPVVEVFSNSHNAIFSPVQATKQHVRKETGVAGMDRRARLITGPFSVVPLRGEEELLARMDVQGFALLVISNVEMFAALTGKHAWEPNLAPPIVSIPARPGRP